MSKVLIAGTPASIWERYQSWFSAKEIEIIRPSQPLPDAHAFVWHDFQNLDAVLRSDSGTIAILGYISPWMMLHHGLVTGQPGEQLLAEWQAGTKAMLQLKYAYPQACFLVNLDYLDVQAWPHLWQRLGIASPAPGVTEFRQPVDNNLQDWGNLCVPLLSPQLPELNELYLCLESHAELLGREPDFNYENRSQSLPAVPEILNVWFNVSQRLQQLAQTSTELTTVKAQILQAQSATEALQLNLEQQKSLLQDMQAGAELTLSQTQSELEQFQIRDQQLTEELAQTKFQALQSGQELRQFQSQLLQAHLELQQSQTHEQHLTEELARSQDQLQQTHAELQISQTQHQQTEQALAQTKLQALQSDQELKQLHSQLLQAHLELQQSQTREQYLTEELARSQTQLQQTHAELQTSQTQHQQTEKALAQSNIQALQAGQELKQFRSQSLRVQVELEESQTREQQLTEKLANTQAQLQQTHTQQQLTQGLLEQSQIQLRQTQTLLEQFQSQLRQSQGQLERMQLAQRLTSQPDQQLPIDYQLLVWDAYSAYHHANLTEMTQCLKKSLKHTPLTHSETILNWLQRFAEFSLERGNHFDTYILTNSAEWQQLVKSITSPKRRVLSNTSK
ncbi:hypothetical protein DO97_04275 [Neosynechococcus sphagnicola sy1]|uniref:Uncharacterized protein n=1 Tax=Neosynechococcus sphagnicola sy1 TaxID=1497020 RepID=A0A098TKV2_9CYAN|nr:hypothetical protein [Neosynechococcus sphagnicola]KGF72919.1 hypothetical protein DO97_04275 [Neosynechococcus sphagnicola sy1]